MRTSDLPPPPPATDEDRRQLALGVRLAADALSLLRSREEHNLVGAIATAIHRCVPARESATAAMHFTEFMAGIMLALADAGWLGCREYDSPGAWDGAPRRTLEERVSFLTAVHGGLSVALEQAAPAHASASVH